MDPNKGEANKVGLKFHHSFLIFLEALQKEIDNLSLEVGWRLVFLYRLENPLLNLSSLLLDHR